MADANSGSWFANVGQDVAKAASEVGQQASSQNVNDRIAATAGQAQQMAGAAQQMTTAAQGGQFAITPEAGQTLIKAYQESVRELDDMRNDLEEVSQAPRLGETPGAKVVGPFTQQVGAGGNGQQGMAETIKNLRATLVQMEQAVQQAMKNYQETDQQAADGAHKAARGL